MYLFIFGLKTQVLLICLTEDEFFRMGYDLASLLSQHPFFYLKQLLNLRIEAEAK